MEEAIALGIDIGGSHITCAPVDLRRQQITEAGLKRAYVDSAGSADEIIAAWSQVIADCCTGMNGMPVKIGIAMPGPFDYEQGISYIKDQDKYDALYGLPVKRMLAEKIGVREEDIAMSNDAVCFLQGEVKAGAGRGFEHVFGLTLGTGFGSAFAHPASVLDADLWCAPYLETQAEDYFSTRWFVRRYAELTGRQVANVKQLFELDGEGEVLHQLFTEFGNNLGNFVVPHCGEHSFEMIVIGGNISNAFSLFAEPLQAVLHQNGVGVEVRRSQLNEHAALFGTANLSTFIQTT